MGINRKNTRGGNRKEMQYHIWEMKSTLPETEKEQSSGGKKEKATQRAMYSVRA